MANNAKVQFQIDNASYQKIFQLLNPLGEYLLTLGISWLSELKPSSLAYKSCLSWKASALSQVTPTLTMRGFTEMLLFAACTLFSTSLVAGAPENLYHLQPSVKHDAQQGSAIRDLLVSREYVCGSNQYICETKYCCDGGWGCCSSLLFFNSLTWLSAYLYIPDGSCCQPGWVPLDFQSSISLLTIYNRTYCVKTPDGEIGCCPNKKLCYGNPKWGQQFPTIGGCKSWVCIPFRSCNALKFWKQLLPDLAAAPTTASLDMLDIVHM
jgi:hypothetical protein